MREKVVVIVANVYVAIPGHDSQHASNRDCPRKKFPKIIRSAAFLSLCSRRHTASSTMFSDMFIHVGWNGAINAYVNTVSPSACRREFRSIYMR
jgi:hypothetical protein